MNVCLVPVNYLNYGPFSSHAPLYDSSFANVSKDESDLLLSTYGDESGAQYAQRFVRSKYEKFEYSKKIMSLLTTKPTK